MKGIYKSLLGLVLTVGMASCESVPVPEVVSTDSATQYEIGYTKNSTVTVNFSSTTDWSVVSTPSGLTLSATQGVKGTGSIVATVNEKNVSNEEKSFSFTILGTNKKGSSSITVTIKQPSCFTISKQNFTAEAEGGEVEVPFSVNGKTITTIDQLNQSLMIYYDETFEEMWAYSASKKSSSGLSSDCAVLGITRSVDAKISLEILSNESRNARVGSFQFALIEKNDTLFSPVMTISQEGTQRSSSVDYSKDGLTYTLQQHTKGLGIPVVIMGDGFLDLDINDGGYEEAMKQAYEYLFTVEPVKSLKDYFDVYYVNAVSETNSFSSGNTAFKVEFAGGSSTTIGGDDDKVVRYAAKVDGIGKSTTSTTSEKFRYNNMLVLVVINDNRYAGTCSMYSDGRSHDIPRGYSIAYIPMTDGSKHNGMGFEQVLHHEALGHGFGKLADEYYYKDMGTLVVDSENYNTLIKWQGYGCYLNVTVESDITKAPWANLAGDSHFAGEDLGCYEGGFTYLKGCYRPTYTNIMVSNVGDFNAPSREMIYKRAMMIANEGDYTYNYDEFVATDEPSWKVVDNTRAVDSTEKNRFLPPLGRPRLKMMPK